MQISKEYFYKVPIVPHDEHNQKMHKKILIIHGIVHLPGIDNNNNIFRANPNLDTNRNIIVGNEKEKQGNVYK